MARRYARSKAEAARLGVPTYYQAKRSKEAAERSGIPQDVLRGHVRSGQVSLRELAEARRASSPVPPRLAARPRSTARAGWHFAITDQGVAQVRASRDQAAMLGRHAQVVADVLARDDLDDAARETLLAPFAGIIVDGHELGTDLDVLESLSRSGAFDDFTVSP